MERWTCAATGASGDTAGVEVELVGTVVRHAGTGHALDLRGCETGGDKVRPKLPEFEVAVVPAEGVAPFAGAFIQAEIETPCGAERAGDAG